MANALYTKGLGHILDADVDWSADNIKVVLVDSADYTLSLANDESLNDIPAGGRVATSGNLASKTSTGGVADSADVTLSTVTGDQSEYVVVYKDSGTASTSWLVAIYDTATGLPVTPNGGDITIAWSNAASKMFAI